MIKLKAWLYVVLWCGLIYCLSDIPNLRITQEWWDIIVRKLAHMAEYAILAKLITRALRVTTTWSPSRIFTWALVLSIVYACTDEYHQSFVLGRVGSPIDVTIDSVGVVLGLLIRP